MNSNRVGILILAAGGSRRMGQPKQLLRLGDSSFLKKVATEAISLNPVCVGVVLGEKELEMRAELVSLSLTIISNPEWEQGMGSSLSTGVRFLAQQDSRLDGILILLCDQPRLGVHDYRTLIEAFDGASIIASRYSGSLGAPAIFPASIYPELIGVDPKTGAKQIITKHSDRVIAIDLPEAAFDVDTPEDYAKLSPGVKKGAFQ